MSRHKYIFCIIFTATIGVTIGHVEMYNNPYEFDLCTDLCVDSFFILPRTLNAKEICQRGCRFYNIISLKNDHNIQLNKEECRLSCVEAYFVENELETCIIGCKISAHKKINELTNGIVLYIEQEEGQKNVLVLNPDFEQIETGIIADPSLKSQAYIGDSVKYKIPETHIRTMPIGEVWVNGLSSEEATGSKSNSSSDWLDCAARNSGIPRWLLMSTILMAVVVALWLSLSTERHSVVEETADPIVDKNEVEFSNPTKFEFISEKA